MGIDSDPPPAAAPSGRALLKAALVAAAAAAVILVVAVLPAEYGIDPTGAGRLLGLNRLFAAGEGIGPAVDAAAGGPVFASTDPPRRDARELIVPSLGSLEFKYHLAQGASMVYSWDATAPIDFDFHTEREGQPASASETFERGEAAAKAGTYVAPYAGLHGWYWENLTDRDVVVTLNATGFFTKATLFLPDAEPQEIAIQQTP